MQTEKSNVPKGPLCLPLLGYRRNRAGSRACCAVAGEEESEASEKTGCSIQQLPNFFPEVRLV